MTSQGHMYYIVLEWQEQGLLQTAGRQLWRQGRMVCAPNDCPQRLPCSNPECEGGGFELGDRVAALLASGKNSEQNSLICRNAIHQDRAKRCLHTIIYSVACVRPYQRQKTPVVASNSAVA